MKTQHSANMLRLAAIVTIATGAITAAAALPAFSTPVALLADFLFWPLDALPSVTDPAARLLAAISGGLMVGLGTAVFSAVRYLLPGHPAACANIVSSAILAWFAVDSFGSVLAGAPLNVVLNAVFAGLFLWPAYSLARSTAA